jgi:hypothetical protein
MKSNKFILIALLGIALFSSCKKDIEGCSDPKSINYNPDATISTGCQYKGCTDKDAENYDATANVSGECVYARDKFIGSYAGSITCPNQLNLLSGATTFTIDENIVGGKNDVNILITTTTAIVPVTGVCSGNKLVIDTEVKDVTITVSGLDVKANIIAKGEVLFDATKKELTGPLNLTVNASLLGSPIVLTDVCPFTGVKK